MGRLFFHSRYGKDMFEFHFSVLSSQFWSVSHLPPGRPPQTGPPYSHAHAQRGCDGDVGAEPPSVPRGPTNPPRTSRASGVRDGGMHPGPPPTGRLRGGAGVRGGMGRLLQVHPELQSECDRQTGAGAWTEISRNSL